MAARILVVVLREWSELRRSPGLLISLVLPATIFVGVPILSLLVSGGSGAQNTPASVIEQAARLRELQPLFRDLTDREVIQAFGVSQFPVLFLMVPIFVPLSLAAHSIVMEKQMRTLEPLLAAPIETWELLVAKASSAWVPGVAISWICYGALLVVARPISPPAIWALMTSPTWLIEVFVVAPLLAFLAVSFSIIVSSRVNDPRVAQQVGGIFVIPIMGLLLGQVAGIVWLSPSMIVWVMLGAAVLDVVTLVMAVRIFARETILTRWR